MSTPTAYERKLYPHVLAERGTKTVDEILAGWDLTEKLTPPTTLDTYIFKKLTIPKTAPPQLSITYIARYQPRFGFKIAVDRGTNMQGKGLHFAVVSLCPGGWYDASRRGDGGDVWVVGKVDAGSDVRHPEWRDGFRWVKKQSANPRLVAIVDVKSFDPEDETRILDEGWSAVSVFADGEYCSHGIFQLPLFEGTPLPGLIRQIKKENLKDALDGAVKSRTIRYGRKYPSIFVRVCDGRRDEELVVGKTPVNLDYLPKGGSGKFAPSGRDKVLRTLVPSGENDEEFVAECAQRFASFPYMPAPDIIARVNDTESYGAAYELLKQHHTYKPLKLPYHPTKAVRDGPIDPDLEKEIQGRR
ncbi:Coiled-coil domain-containing protein 17 [Rhizophlyctis rosea]|nr:Coiled-coil domain-containing protein 17 [Rhizophlyctis rosea]